MKKYIFLTNQYLPKPGATGLCVHQIAKYLAKANDVYTICYEDGNEQKEFDGVKTRRIRIPSYLRDNNSKTDLYRKLQHIDSIFHKLLYITKYPLRSRKLVDSFFREVETIISDVNEATIIASYTPIEAVIAAARIKEKYPDRVKIVYYSADTLSNERGSDGFLPAEYRTKCGLKWETFLFGIYDAILIMECHKEHYFSDNYLAFRHKYKTANFPMFSRIETTNDALIKNEDKMRFVYTGTLYKTLRNPEYMIKVLIDLSKVIDMEVFFLGSGDCEDIMRTAEASSSNVINYIGMQPHDVALQYISSADVLLSIGNVESPMAPSKIYEYMSTGKPILHTYSYQSDPCINPLLKYGNAFLMYEGDPVDIKQLCDFLKSIKNLDYDCVEEIFKTSTPAFTAEIIERV